MPFNMNNSRRRQKDGLQLRRAISIQAEGKRSLEKHAIAPSAARLCSTAFQFRFRRRRARAKKTSAAATTIRKGTSAIVKARLLTAKTKPPVFGANIGAARTSNMKPKIMTRRPRAPRETTFEIGCLATVCSHCADRKLANARLQLRRAISIQAAQKKIT
jgi:hypothetical protein